MKTAIVVGAGHRALLYASYARLRPDELRIVGVADPSVLRRERVADEFGLSGDQLFESADALAAVGKRADFVINGTMDHQHVATSLPLLAAGYDLLLEKPFATSEDELWTLVMAARQHGREVCVCHVLRYAPFYAAIRREVEQGTIGDVISVQATEHVSYHHLVVAYVRGKWRRKAYGGSSLLMAKSCHDLDLIAWMKRGVKPVRVASFGSNFQFRPERAPVRAGTRCLVDCPIEADCLYSARKHYVDHPERWSFYIWDGLEHLQAPTQQEREEYLRGETTYGRCVWKCDNDLVDHQAVLIDFADGCTATLNLVGGSAKPSRSLRLIGTRGEIEGNLEDGTFVIREIDTRSSSGYSEKSRTITRGDDASGAQGTHAGGDLLLVEDYLRRLRGEEPSISATTLEDSLAGHLIGFGADQSLESGRVESVRFRCD